jgi:lysophospholipase L1-like esterase
MAYPAILGRWLNRPTINLGFSGNGVMEPEVATLLAELDPAIYVIDCLPNLLAPEVASRTEQLVRIIRHSKSLTPIVLVESISYQDAMLEESKERRYKESNAALYTAYKRLVSSGVKNIEYVKGDKLLGDDGEATVDGTHPTDLGFLRMAQTLEPVLRKTLKYRH